MTGQDAWHRKQYNMVRQAHPEIPDWESLTDEQREKVRAANNAARDFMDAVSRAIITGGPLPNPFED